MMSLRISYILCFCCIVVMLDGAMAQLPETDIWLFQIEKQEKESVCKNGINITNRPGYDNQPAFSPDNKTVLYSSVRADKQADIYGYRIGSKKTNRLTNTPESEYSPTITPDGLMFSVVVVEVDSAQRIQCYSLDGHRRCYTVSPEDSVGYHTWYNADSILYYKLTEPHSLHIQNIRTGNDVKICNKPCRAFKTIPGTHYFIYGVKDTAGVVYRKYDPVLKKSMDYARAATQSEDFIWNAEWGLVRSEGSALLRYDERQALWIPLFDFSTQGIQKITRFMFDSKNKQLVLVSNK